MADNEQPTDNAGEPLTIEAMFELDSEWNSLRMMAIVCNQLFNSFLQADFTESQALRLTALMVKENLDE